VASTGIALGDTNGGTHSNLKVEVQRGGNTWTTVNDNSASSIPFNSRFYSFSTTAGNDVIGVVSYTKIRLTFNTTNTISLSNIILNKVQERQTSLLGTKPNGAQTYIGATNNSNLKVSIQEYGDTPAIDAFGRLRVSDPFTIFDSKQLHDKQPIFWDEELGGSATSTHVSADSNVEMTVTANAADYVIRQTKQRFNYQPGKSQLSFFTFQSPQVSGITCRMGMFDGTGVNNLDPHNGIFFECDGDISWNIAKDGTVAETATQANWNVDKLDGTGKSGIDLDVSATQIAIVDYEWLGVGRVRVGFVIDGIPYYCHDFNHANDPTFTSVYMSTPNLPLRYSIETDGTNGSTLRHICSTVISEGGVEKTGILRSLNTGTTAISTNSVGTVYPLISIRLKDAYKDVTVVPESINVMIATNDRYRWSLHINPTFAVAPTWTSLTNSAVEYAIGVGGADLLTNDGIVEASGYASSSSRESSEGLNTALRIGSDIGGTKDTLVLAITPLTSNMSSYGALNFRELL
jgi:hypothetical protein